jgi:nitroreductase
MDTLDAIRGQRVIRSFRPEPLADQILEAILHAGRRAGSSKNLQRWSFITVTDRDALKRLSSVGPWAGHVAGATVAVALVTPDPYASGAPLSVMWDLGRAAQNMTLAAWALGVGSCPATVYQQGDCRAILGYPADRHCEFILSLGWPADDAELTRPPRSGGRRDLAQLLHSERW